MNIRYIESIRRCVIDAVEQDTEGSSEYRIPALFLYGTAEEVYNDLGPEMVVKLQIMSEIFLLGVEIGISSSL